MENSPLQDIQAWFANNFDGDWEHSHGISIQSTDNPGWQAVVKLPGPPVLKDVRSLEYLHSGMIEITSDGFRCFSTDLDKLVVLLAALVTQLPLSRKV